MLVEDNELNAEIAGVLPGDQGAEVTRVSDAKECLAAGMNAHLARPLQMELLKKTIVGQLKREKVMADKNNGK